MSIKTNIEHIRKHFSADITLVCVSKFQPQEAIEEAYSAGERNFGESRVQELVRKREQLPADIRWHFIGHLQTNKIKTIAPFVSLIHSVDSPRLLAAIENEGAKCNRQIDILLQVHIAREETKFGFAPEELRDFLAFGKWRDCHFARICGLMGMATFTNCKAQISEEMATLKALFDRVKEKYFSHSEQFNILSMGMSGDYPIALAHGATMLRIGSDIFGHREG